MYILILIHRLTDSAGLYITICRPYGGFLEGIIEQGDDAGCYRYRRRFMQALQQCSGSMEMQGVYTGNPNVSSLYATIS